MGELSGKIGKYGERVVLNFLNNVGWGDSSLNIDLPCLMSDNHKSEKAKNGRNTHGIDGIFPYESPLFDNIADHIVISIKFSEKNYKKNSNSDFKDHFKDLAYAMECYDKSELQNENNEAFTGMFPETKGLLIWIHNKDEEESVLDKISNVRLDDDFNFNSIYVLDNNRISFLNKCISFVRNTYNNHNIEFHYIDTGNNPSTINKQYDGDKLPIQMIFSDIQLFKVEEKLTQNSLLVMVIKDNFEKDYLKRIFGLAHTISKNFTHINIYFPDYDELAHKEDVTKTKREFRKQSFTNKITVSSFSERFQNIGE